MEQNYEKSLKILLSDRKKYQEIWKESSKANRRKPVQFFLPKIKFDPKITQIITNDQDLRLKITQLLGFLQSSEDANKLKAAIQKFQQALAAKLVEGNEKQFTKIEGSNFIVNVVYNSDKFNLDYSIQGGYFIKKFFEPFIKKQIGKLKIKVRQQISKIRIFAEKQFIQDKYTGSYTFDPFFNMVKFYLTHTNGQLFKNANSFSIIHQQNISIKFQDNTNADYWIDENIFCSYDPLYKLIHFICLKEEADDKAKQQFQQSLDRQDFRTVGDLLKVKDFKDISKYITRHKWAVELQIELQKIKSSQIKSSKKNNFDQEKMVCLRQGYSHKILRYLFMKSFQKDDQGIKQLRIKIPYLNSKIVQQAIRLVKSDLVMDDLLQEIKDHFKAFTFPMSSPYRSEAPMGMLFYGPPGTGKTKLTQQLAQLMGFHLVSRGLSSTVFQKQLVGQSKGVVNSFLTRSYLSNHLICSISIDEIDSVVLKRGGQNKNTPETLSKFLSILGGNESVPNIVLLASTNLIQKMDDAFLRRVVPHIYVGLPNSTQRMKILQSYLSKHQSQYFDLHFLTQITPNFSGAGLQSIAKRMKNVIKEKNRQGNKNLRFKQQQLLSLAHAAAVDFKIKFGYSTYQKLDEEMRILNQNLDINFFKQIKNKVCLMTNKHNIIQMTYGKKLLYFNNNTNNQEWCYQLCKVNTPIARLDAAYIGSWFLKIAQTKLVTSKAQFLSKLKNYEQPTLLLFKIKQGELNQCISKISQLNNLYICLLSEDIYSQDSFIKQMQLIKPPSTLTGRVLVDLTQTSVSGMQFQLNKQEIHDYQLGVQVRPFFRQCSRSSQALPIIVQELMRRDLGIIKVIDSSFFTNLGAFQQQQCIETLNNLQEECRLYKKSALIILIDSIIRVNQSISTSSTGNSKSLTISQINLYHSILNAIQNLSSFSSQQERWVTIVVENNQLLQNLKRDIKWPLNANEMKTEYDQKCQKEKEKRKKQSRVCRYCRQIYTAQQNEKKRQCIMHYGYFVRTTDFHFCENLSIIDLSQAQFQQIVQQIFIQENVQLYKYSCCWKSLDADGCRKFHHFSGQHDEIDELSEQTAKTDAIRLSQCKKLKDRAREYTQRAKLFSRGRGRGK